MQSDSDDLPPSGRSSGDSHWSKTLLEQGGSFHINVGPVSQRFHVPPGANRAPDRPPPNSPAPAPSDELGCPPKNFSCPPTSKNDLTSPAIHAPATTSSSTAGAGPLASSSAAGTADPSPLLTPVPRTPARAATGPASAAALTSSPLGGGGALTSSPLGTRASQRIIPMGMKGMVTSQQVGTSAGEFLREGSFFCRVPHDLRFNAESCQTGGGQTFV